MVHWYHGSGDRIAARTGGTAMTDEDLLRAFEACSIPAGELHHREHVRVAWAYLERHPPLEALARFVDALRRFAAHHGAAGVYHETITLAFFFLIAERRARMAGAHGWEEFAAANCDLMGWRGGVLSRYYRDETLASELARRVFVLPDRLDVEPAGAEARA
jgi:hypothetical protein